MPAAPCTSRTAWPSATSTAGSRVEHGGTHSGCQRVDGTPTRRRRSATSSGRRPAHDEHPVSTVAQTQPGTRQHRAAPRSRSAGRARRGTCRAPVRGCQSASAPARPTARRSAADGAGAALRASSAGCRRPFGLRERGTARSARACGHAAPRSQRGHPVAQQPGAGVTRLLRVELGGRERRRARPRPRTARRARRCVTSAVRSAGWAA